MQTGFVFSSRHLSKIIRDSCLTAWLPETVGANNKPIKKLKRKGRGMSYAVSALQNSDTFPALESHTMPRTVSVPRAVSWWGKTEKVSNSQLGLTLRLSARRKLMLRQSCKLLA